MTPLLTPEEVAKILSISVSRLNSMRYLGEGPDFLKLGHRTIRYRSEAIEEWLTLREQRL